VRLLLDTHALIWALGDDPRLGVAARQIVADPANEVWVSVISLLELTIKARIGKLRADIAEVTETLGPAGFRLLELRPAHLIALAQLPVFAEHRDPFDHTLIAQAVAEAMTFVSDDRNASRYPVQRLRCSDAARPAAGS
jgi:PIN domain nuclease of toxin-antitoxin system